MSKIIKIQVNKQISLLQQPRCRCLVIEAFVAQRQSTGLVNQGSWVQFPPEAVFCLSSMLFEFSNLLFFSIDTKNIFEIEWNLIVSKRKLNLTLDRDAIIIKINYVSYNQTCVAIQSAI